MNNSRDLERSGLHKTIWRIANDLRGSVDGWDFKNYVLGMLFYRFISENLTEYINSTEPQTSADSGGGPSADSRPGSADSGARPTNSTPASSRSNPTFNYEALSDEFAKPAQEVTVQEKGFYILPSQLFANLRKRAEGDINLNETLREIFDSIEASAKDSPSEKNFKGLFADIDVNSNKLGSSVEERNKKLVKLLNAIGDLPLRNRGFASNSIDLFGDAYEYLMQMYASSAGKSGGEYYTPQEVSELLARITLVGKTEVNKVYDPACGSGSLLLKFAKVLGAENVHNGFFGQEINLTTYNLCRINMFLHNINYEQFDIAHGDSLTAPRHTKPHANTAEPFEAIVSNPPYSTNWEGKDNPLLIEDPRFSPAGILAPKSKADLAFTMHMLSALASNGTAAIVEFPGVLYRGGAEQKIRQYLIDNNFVQAVIHLPPDLFFGTSIATCIIVLKKSKSDNATLFIQAKDECIRSGNKNKLSPENAHAILTAYTERRNNAHFTRLVPNEDIAENGYNLSVSAYIQERNESDVIDIRSLNAEIQGIVRRQSALRTRIDSIVADLESDSPRADVDTSADVNPQTP